MTEYDNQGTLMEFFISFFGTWTALVVGGYVAYRYVVPFMVEAYKVLANALDESIIKFINNTRYKKEN